MAAEDSKGPDMGGVTFEDLAHIEEQFESADLEILRYQQKLHEPLFQKRGALVSKIEHFWANVFESAPPELDQFIQPTDSEVFAEALTDFSVSRFEINEPKGSPRSFSVKLTFSDNKFFEDKELEKKFWFRRSANGSSGYISEPVPIKWKAGKDVTKGLNDAVIKLYKRKHQAGGASNGDAKSGQELPEYADLLKKFETSASDAQSFFVFFSWISDGTYISAEESVAATDKFNERVAKLKAGEEVEDEDDEDEDDDDEDDTYDIISEVYPMGEDVANLLADEVWPNAIRMYQEARAFEFDDEELSDMEVEELDDEDGEDGPVDIRALVSGKGKSDGPSPSKKRKAP